MSDDVDWDDVQVVAEQGAIGVYTSLAGYIVVRERDPSYVIPGVVFHPKNAEAIIRAIIKEAELPFVLTRTFEEDLAPANRRVKDATAAERQRRRREKLRKSRDSDSDNCVVTEVTAAQPAIPSDHAQLVLLRSPAVEGEEEVQKTAFTR
ncbi:hypothetical protein [Bradyrhizobium sp. CCBAU 53380]|uniref:hypothetical protein n=1 Tax=Bradyrhizobium sp. CCBAU 53380 TaxID=1325117 RepID=UPI002303E1A2|nr:hypothetical protein [Bradyrhizobium sp. CCBAU 53380]MDA9421563.1 hypothetical protein [Bradyrhizobium sp. CCBAU 53380]